ncbi:MAG: hypothetical protein COZ70_13630 [Deltaproteobacteria bacterium CG_4_8_14_3_um_filter_51_11]|nr:MAG: hypothetical protein COX16_10075 [Deltaproteobacteria bacterium CG23_combo_of_CG06-09_8_20_14_all_51_20]PIV98813.1 MAG: hypothetical protein COW41_09515 [Deltaproteobacteria bacterium CG17_big_fil_post_rev_8_21_14_2_50_51_6]PIX18544.1 MAG: hypothetical protein COZ70_13630 [Deltaproteobacteria bacterium CG_4_8_14_3_um_filter_51_11]PIY26518.1 MAG: hypothetical protein COZ11_02485 [Deltaproteobacteria bacterium CG_4_10_14_3_um_filter_51_14]
MGAYDIASKVILTHCRKAAVEFFLGIPVKECELIDLPQETATLSQADFPIKVITKEGHAFIVLLEIQSRWETDMPLRLLGYDVRYRLKTKLPVQAAIILLTKSKTATDYFECESITYRFRVVRIADMDAKEVIERGQVCLNPFVPLMRGGRALFDEAEEALYFSDLGRSQKSDLLTGMALLSGLIAGDLPKRLLERRRDIIMESVAYEIIKNEGIQYGIQQGIQQGMVKEAQEMLIEAASARFGTLPSELENAISLINSRASLKDLMRKLMKAESLDGFAELVPKGNIE